MRRSFGWATALVIALSAAPAVSEHIPPCGIEGTPVESGTIGPEEFVIGQVAAETVRRYEVRLGFPVIGVGVGGLLLMSTPDVYMLLCRRVPDPFGGHETWQDTCPTPRTGGVRFCPLPWGTVLVWCTCDAGSRRDFILWFPVVGVPI